MTVAFERELFTRAVRRLPPFDLQTLLGLALLADPTRHELSGPWDAIAENLGVPPLLLPPVLARLQSQGYVRGRVDAPEGVHLHLDHLLCPAASIPLNLPLEHTP